MSDGLLISRLFMATLLRDQPALLVNHCEGLTQLKRLSQVKGTFARWWLDGSPITMGSTIFH